MSLSPDGTDVVEDEGICGFEDACSLSSGAGRDEAAERESESSSTPVVARTEEDVADVLQHPPTPTAAVLSADPPPQQLSPSDLANLLLAEQQRPSDRAATCANVLPGEHDDLFDDFDRERYAAEIGVFGCVAVERAVKLGQCDTLDGIADYAEQHQEDYDWGVPLKVAEATLAVHVTRVVFELVHGADGAEPEPPELSEKSKAELLSKILGNIAVRGSVDERVRRIKAAKLRQKGVGGPRVAEFLRLCGFVLEGAAPPGTEATWHCPLDVEGGLLTRELAFFRHARDLLDELLQSGELLGALDEDASGGLVEEGISREEHVGSSSDPVQPAGLGAAIVSEPPEGGATVAPIREKKNPSEGASHRPAKKLFRKNGRVTRSALADIHEARATGRQDIPARVTKGYQKEVGPAEDTAESSRGADGKVQQKRSGGARLQPKDTRLTAPPQGVANFRKKREENIGSDGEEEEGPYTIVPGTSISEQLWQTFSARVNTGTKGSKQRLLRAKKKGRFGAGAAPMPPPADVLFFRNMLPTQAQLPSYAEQYVSQACTRSSASAGGARIEQLHVATFQTTLQGALDPAFLGRRALDLTNHFRLRRSLPPLEWNQAIADIAAEHAKEMALGKRPFNHDGFDRRVAQFPMPVHSAAENLAWSSTPEAVFSTGDSDPAATAVDGWIKSPGHCRNLLSLTNLCGVGVASMMNGRTYFTQLFCRSREDVF